jgi:DNA modification methylase
MNGPETQRAAAEQRAQTLVETIREVGVAGSLREIAAALNERGVPTYGGGRWHPTTVGRLLERAKIKPGIDVVLGDCRDVLSTIAAGSIQTVVTSPPYWQARTFGHKRQMGLENSPDAYVGELVDMFRKIRRVLRDDGTVWLILGDSFAQKKGHTCGLWPARPDAGAVLGKDANGRGLTVWTYRNPQDFGLKPKDLVGLPWRVASALRDDGWYLRQDVIWSKPSFVPEPVADRPITSHEHVFLFSKSSSYRFSREALRRGGGLSSVWRIPTAGQKGHPGCPGHPAQFPVALAIRCIAPTCPVGGVVLDPFGGSGTVGVAARKLGRRAILIELNADYAKLATDRLAAD